MKFSVIIIGDFSEGAGQSPTLRQVRAACLERGSRHSARLRFGLPKSLEPGLPRSLCWDCASAVVLSSGLSLLEGCLVQVGLYARHDEEIKIHLSWLSSN